MQKIDRNPNFITIEFSEKDEMLKWEKKQERLRKENELIKKIAELAAKEIEADNTLTHTQAFKKVIAANPDISKTLAMVRQELIKEQLLREAPEVLLNPGNFNAEEREKLINNYAEKNPEISYVAAVKAVAKERPELFRG